MSLRVGPSADDLIDSYQFSPQQTGGLRLAAASKKQLSKFNPSPPRKGGKAVASVVATSPEECVDNTDISSNNKDNAGDLSSPIPSFFEKDLPSSPRVIPTPVRSQYRQVNTKRQQIGIQRLLDLVALTSVPLPAEKHVHLAAGVSEFLGCFPEGLTPMVAIVRRRPSASIQNRNKVGGGVRGGSSFKDSYGMEDIRDGTEVCFVELMASLCRLIDEEEVTKKETREKQATPPITTIITSPSGDNTVTSRNVLVISNDLLMALLALVERCSRPLFCVTLTDPKSTSEALANIVGSLVPLFHSSCVNVRIAAAVALRKIIRNIRKAARDDLGSQVNPKGSDNNTTQRKRLFVEVVEEKKERFDEEDDTKNKKNNNDKKKNNPRHHDGAAGGPGGISDDDDHVAICGAENEKKKDSFNDLTTSLTESELTRKPSKNRKKKEKNKGVGEVIPQWKTDMKEALTYNIVGAVYFALKSAIKEEAFQINVVSEEVGGILQECKKKNEGVGIFHKGRNHNHDHDFYNNDDDDSDEDAMESGRKIIHDEYIAPTAIKQQGKFNTIREKSLLISNEEGGLSSAPKSKISVKNDKKLSTTSLLSPMLASPFSRPQTRIQHEVKQEIELAVKRTLTTCESSIAVPELLALLFVIREFSTFRRPSEFLVRTFDGCLLIVEMLGLCSPGDRRVCLCLEILWNWLELEASVKRKISALMKDGDVQQQASYSNEKGKMKCAKLNFTSGATAGTWRGGGVGGVTADNFLLLSDASGSDKMNAHFSQYHHDNKRLLSPLSEALRSIKTLDTCQRCCNSHMLSILYKLFIESLRAGYKLQEREIRNDIVTIIGYIIHAVEVVGKVGNHDSKKEKEQCILNNRGDDQQEYLRLFDGFAEVIFALSCGYEMQESRAKKNKVLIEDKMISERINPLDFSKCLSYSGKELSSSTSSPRRVYSSPRDSQVTQEEAAAVSSSCFASSLLQGMKKGVDNNSNFLLTPSLSSPHYSSLPPFLALLPSPFFTYVSSEECQRQHSLLKTQQLKNHDLSSHDKRELERQSLSLVPHHSYLLSGSPPDPQFHLSTSDENLQFKILSWLLLTHMCCFGDEEHIFHLFNWGFVEVLLSYVNVKCDLQSIVRWSTSQLIELQEEALLCLVHLATIQSRLSSRYHFLTTMKATEILEEYIEECPDAKLQDMALTIIARLAAAKRKDNNDQKELAIIRRGGSGVSGSEENNKDNNTWSSFVATTLNRGGTTSFMNTRGALHENRNGVFLWSNDTAVCQHLISLTLKLLNDNDNDVLCIDCLNMISDIVHEDPTQQSIFRECHGVECLIPFFNFTPVYSTTKREIVVISAVACGWSTCFGNRESEDVFIANDGVHAFLCAIQNMSFGNVGFLLSALADLLFNKDAVTYFRLWRSPTTGQSAVQMLIELWKITEFCTSAKEMLNGDDISGNDRNVALTNQQLSFPSNSNSLSSSSSSLSCFLPFLSDLRLLFQMKIYSCLRSIGFSDHRELSPIERATLAHIEIFEDLLSDLAWSFVVTHVESDGRALMLIPADQIKLEHVIAEREKRKAALMAVQEAYFHQAHKRAHDAELTFYKTLIKKSDEVVPRRVKGMTITETKLRKSQMLKQSFHRSQALKNI